MSRTTRNYLYTCFLIIFMILLSGCSEAKPVTSADEPTLRARKIVGKYSNDDDFWKMAYKEIPTVTFEQAESEDYLGTYVCIDMDCVSTDGGYSVGDYWREVGIEMAIPLESGSYYSYSNYVVRSSDTLFRYGIDVLSEMKQGDVIKLCVYLTSDDLSECYVVGAKSIGVDENFDYDQYKTDAELQKENEKLKAEKEEKDFEKMMEDFEEKHKDKKVNYNSLQQIFLNLTFDTTKEELEKWIEDALLPYSVEDYKASKTTHYVIAFEDGVARQRYADSGESVDVIFNLEDGTFMYAEYSHPDSSFEGLLYNYGTCSGLSEDKPNNNYSGYYTINYSAKGDYGMTVYSDGKSTKTRLSKEPSAEVVVGTVHFPR